MNRDDMSTGCLYLATIRLARQPDQPDQIIRADGPDGYVTTLGGLVRRECVTNVRPVALIDWNEWGHDQDWETEDLLGWIADQWEESLPEPDDTPLTQAEVTTRKYPRLPAGGGMAL